MSLTLADAPSPSVPSTSSILVAPIGNASANFWLSSTTFYVLPSQSVEIELLLQETVGIARRASALLDTTLSDVELLRRFRERKSRLRVVSEELPPQDRQEGATAEILAEMEEFAEARGAATNHVI